MGNGRPDLTHMAGDRFDCIVVGGGIYGVMLALEAVRRGLRPLLVERDDFGAATSHNSLRIIHGGLRYLQSADLPRFRESVLERRWFLRTFPDFVRPLPCLMPLYNEGVKRTGILRAALAANDVLSANRNAGVTEDAHLPAGRILGASAATAVCPTLDGAGLVGAAVWHDAIAPSTPLLLREVLRWARAEGATAVNYVEATGVAVDGGRVLGVRVRDRVDGGEHLFRAPVVINAAGPWSRLFSAACGDERPALFVPTLAWNVLFRRPALADHALAVQPRRPGAQTYFLLPWKGALLVGTGHAPWSREVEAPRPSDALLAEFLADLSVAVPGLDLGPDDVLRVFAGLLPCAQVGTARLTTRPVIVDHGGSGGAVGFFSVSGIKLTTARRVADAVLRRAFPGVRRRTDAEFTRPPKVASAPEHPALWHPAADEVAWHDEVVAAGQAEPVTHLTDVLLRRTTLGDNPERARALAPNACRLLGWDAARTQAECARLASVLDGPRRKMHETVASSVGGAPAAAQGPPRATVGEA